MGTWRVGLATAAGLIALGWGEPARGHDPPRAFGIVWSEAEADEFVVRTNRGLIFSGAAGSRLLCHAGLEAHSSERLPLVASPEGGWLVGTSKGLLHLDQQGCPDEPAPRLSQGAIQDFRSHPDQSTVLYAVTADGSVGSALYRSDDAGETFTEVISRQSEAEFFNSVAIDARSDDRIYLAGSRLDLELRQAQHFVASWSEKTGLQSNTVSLLDSEIQIRVLAVDPYQTRVVAHTIASGGSEQPDRLLVSVDAGRSWEVWHAAMGMAQLGFSPETERGWLATDDGLFRSKPGEAFELLPLEHPPSCVFETEEELFLCDARGVHRSIDQARSLETVLAFYDVTEPVSCDGTGQPVPDCSEDWADFRAEMLAAKAAAHADDEDDIRDADTDKSSVMAAVPGPGCGIGAKKSAGAGRLSGWTLIIAAVMCVIGRKARLRVRSSRVTLQNGQLACAIPCNPEPAAAHK